MGSAFGYEDADRQAKCQIEGEEEKEAAGSLV
jgi:hypothetical protein